MDKSARVHNSQLPKFMSEVLTTQGTGSVCPLSKLAGMWMYVSSFCTHHQGFPKAKSQSGESHSDRPLVAVTAVGSISGSVVC